MAALARMAGGIFVNDNVPSQVTMRGVTRYVRHVVDGLIARWGTGVTVYSPDRRDYGPARYIPVLRFRGIRRFGIHDRLAALAAGPAHPAVVYSTFFGTMRTSAAQIFTLYDLLLERQVRASDPRGWMEHRYVAETRQCLERAARILTISHGTARDLASFYPHLDANKIRVTYPGVDPVFLEPGDAPSTEGRPYLLYVGERAGHKNFTRLLEAFGRSGLARDVVLRVHSRVPAWTEAEAAILRGYTLAGAVQLLAPVPDAELRRAYAGAVALVYPSLEEGFGLPVLEALACGTLVAASNRPSMPEVGGAAPFYFDPASPESLAACLRQVAGLGPLARRERIALGQARAREFTWARCQAQTVRAFEELVP